MSSKNQIIPSQFLKTQAMIISKHKTHIMSGNQMGTN